MINDIRKYDTTARARVDIPVPECPFALQRLGLKLHLELDNPSGMLQIQHLC